MKLITVYFDDHDMPVVSRLVAATEHEAIEIHDRLKVAIHVAGLDETLLVEVTNADTLDEALKEISVLGD